MGALLDFALRRPSLTFNSLSQLPLMLRGFAWPDRRALWNAQPPPGEPAEREEATDNPLRRFFDARETGRGIWKWLHYFDLYHRHFEKFRGRTIDLVEIGVFSGGSLEMWRSYFGDGCHVHGVDIADVCRAYADDHTSIHIGDQEDRAFWKSFKERVAGVDIVIDDGGHGAEQQIVTLEEVLPHLRPGGVYVCEDVHGVHNGFASYVQGLANNLNAVTYQDASLGHRGGIRPNALQACVHSIHLYPYVVVIEKSAAPVEQLIAPKRGTEWQPIVTT